MRRYIFLDIDGVLNDHGWDPLALCGEIHTDKVRRLNRLLFITGAKLVMSSAWRYIMLRRESTIQGMDWLLRSHGLHAGRLIDITRPDTMVRQIYDGQPKSWPQVNERGQQILDWLAGNWLNLAFREKVEYIVIDDLDLGITEARHPFVQTNGKVGLTDADVDRAIKLFRQPPDGYLESAPASLMPANAPRPYAE